LHRSLLKLTRRKQQRHRNGNGQPARSPIIGTPRAAVPIPAKVKGWPVARKEERRLKVNAGKEKRTAWLSKKERRKEQP
jgi:hypothetical protein